jgi:hypothetical protein
MARAIIDIENIPLPAFDQEIVPPVDPPPPPPENPNGNQTVPDRQ